MDTLFIFFGMAGGATVGYTMAQRLPNPSALTIVFFSMVGGACGTLFGYVFAWLAVGPQKKAPNSPFSSNPRQIAGAKCQRCQQRILVVTDGHFCLKCHRVFCKVCEPDVPCSECRGRLETHDDASSENA